MHNVQYYILDQLMLYAYRRFSELRPKHVDSNLFQYHLTKLIRDGYIAKSHHGYSLSAAGLRYADHHSSELKRARPQPKIISIVRVFNTEGNVLLIKNEVQPFINTLHFPAGKVHEDESMLMAARRELFEKTGIRTGDLSHKTLVHGAIRQDGIIVSEYYANVFDVDGYDDESLEWYCVDESLDNLSPLLNDLIHIPRDTPLPYYEFSAYTDTERMYAMFDEYLDAISRHLTDTPIVITLGGPTASGKTTLIHKTMNTFKEKCIVVSTDDYYIGKERMQKEMPFNEEENYDHPQSMDIDLLVSHLKLLKSGKTIQVPVYDMFTSEPSGETTETDPAAIIIVEGIAANDPRIVKVASVTGSLNVPAEERLRRRIARDISRNGQEADQVRRLFNKVVEPSYQKYFAAQDLTADFVIRPIDDPVPQTSNSTN